MKEEPICYPYLTGAYEGMLSFLAFKLSFEGLIKDSQYDDIKEFIASEVNRIRKAERDSTNNVPS